MFIIKYYFGTTVRTRTCATFDSAEDTVRNLLAESRRCHKPVIIANMHTGEVWQTASTKGEYIDFPKGWY